MNDLKKKLIKNIEIDIYCRIKPSKKHGVGVFAIRDIPKSINKCSMVEFFTVKTNKKRK